MRIGCVVLIGLAVGVAFSGDCRAGERVDEVIASMQEAYGSINDYQCRFEELSLFRNRREERVINFYFKKPNLIRMDILTGNRPFDDGSVGVYTGDGKVTGRRGGVLSGIVLKVPKDSPLATTIRGVRFDESDIETVLNRLDFYRTRGRIELRETDGSFIFACAPSDPFGNEGISKDIVWIDRGTLLITRNERYEGETLVQAASWKEYIINAGLPVELFDVRFDVEELRVRGVPLLSRNAR